MQLRREGFLSHGFTQGCPECKATLPGTLRQGHAEASRLQMREGSRSSPEDQQKVYNQREREDEHARNNVRTIERCIAKRMSRDEAWGRKRASLQRKGSSILRESGGRRPQPLRRLALCHNMPRSVLGKPVRTRPGQGGACASRSDPRAPVPDPSTQAMDT